MGMAERFNQAKKAREQKAAAATAVALDRFGRPLVPGAHVEFHTNLPTVFGIESITPELDPRAPTGVLRVKMVVEVELFLQDRTPASALTLVSMPADAADSPFHEHPSEQVEKEESTDVPPA